MALALKEIAMFLSIFRRSHASTPAPVLSAPRGLPTVIAEGDPTHEHGLKEVPWNEKEFGPQTGDFDKDHGGALEFPKCTYKTAYACSCGRQVIMSQRSLI